MIVRNVRSRSNEMSAHDAVNSPLTISEMRKKGAWIKIDDYPCRQAFRHFMN